MQKIVANYWYIHVGAGVLSVLTTSVVAGNIVGVYLGNVIATQMAEKKS